MDPGPAPTGRRRPNVRGQGGRLRAEVVEVATRLLDDLADDEALSLGAGARAAGVAPNSVYLYFPDRDALVLAVLQHCHEQLVRAGDEAAAAAPDPAQGLRAMLVTQGEWAAAHPGLYKVLHESAVHRRRGMPFKHELLRRTTEAVARCMDAGLASPGDPASVAIDVRAAVNGMLALRINEPDLPWPPVAEQIERFLLKLAGLVLPAA